MLDKRERKIIQRSVECWTKERKIIQRIVELRVRLVSSKKRSRINEKVDVDR